MNILYWLIYGITVLEFTVSSINTLMNSRPHIQRLHEVKFPIAFAKVLAVVEVIAVISVILGVWQPAIRMAGGIVLALCFLPILLWALRAKRPIGDLLALGFFIACALVTGIFS